MLGLTLGEMMAVLAVFLILAIVFFMSSTHAMVKARLSRVLREEKDLVSALQFYQLQYSELPDQEQGWDKLTSMVAFMSRIPDDPFKHASAEKREYIYISDLSQDHRCLIVSVGPDGKSDVEEALDRKSRSAIRLAETNWPYRSRLMSPDAARKFIILHSYDPTNGTTSRGDIITSYEP